MNVLCLLLASQALVTDASRDFDFDRVAIGGGGMVTGVLFQPAVPGLLYARSDTAGLFRWDPKGARWTNLTDWMPIDAVNVKSCPAFAIDPNPGKDRRRQDTIYAAFGAYFNTLQNSPEHNGLYRSFDRGETWQKLWDGVATKRKADYGEDTVLSFGGNGWNRNTGERLAVDPANSDVLYVGTANAGVWRSTDARAAKPTFGKLALPEGFTNDGYHPRGVQILLVDPRGGAVGTGAQRRSRVVYAAYSASRKDQSPFFEGGVWQTTDGGAQWRRLPGSPVSPCRMALGPEGTVLLAERRAEEGKGHDDNFPASPGGIWSFDPKRDRWSALPGTEGQSFISVAARGPRIVAGSGNGIVWRSLDGGRNWTKKVWRTWMTPNESGGGISFDDPGWMVPGFQYPMGYDVQFDPNDPQRAVFCDPFGVHDTPDVWAETVRFEPRLRGLENTVPFDLMAPSVGPTTLYATAADVNGWQISDLGRFPERQMAQAIFGDDRPRGDAVVTDVAEAPSDPNKVAVLRMTEAGYYNSYRRVYVSLDAGRTWRGREVPEVDVAGKAGQGTGRLAISATDPDHAVFFGPFTRPKVTRNLFAVDEPIRWEDSTGLPFLNENNWVYAFSSARMVADAVDGQSFYLTRFEGDRPEVWASRDGGKSWARAHAEPLDGAPWPRSGHAMIAAVRNPETGRGELWLANGERGLRRSTDGGRTFAPVANLGFCPGFAFGKPAPGTRTPTLFVAGRVGREDGLFLSRDLGGSWVRMTPKGKPWFGGTGSLSDMVGDPRVYGRVFVAVPGAGVLYSTLK
jgi:hypothetical protein